MGHQFSAQQSIPLANDLIEVQRHLLGVRLSRESTNTPNHIPGPPDILSNPFNGSPHSFVIGRLTHKTTQTSLRVCNYCHEWLAS